MTTADKKRVYEGAIDFLNEGSEKLYFPGICQALKVTGGYFHPESHIDMRSEFPEVFNQEPVRLLPGGDWFPWGLSFLPHRINVLNEAIKVLNLKP